MIDKIQSGDEGPKIVRVFQSLGVVLKAPDFKTLRQKITKELAVSNPKKVVFYHNKNRYVYMSTQQQ